MLLLSPNCLARLWSTQQAVTIRSVLSGRIWRPWPRRHLNLFFSCPFTCSIKARVFTWTLQDIANIMEENFFVMLFFYNCEWCCNLFFSCPFTCSMMAHALYGKLDSYLIWKFTEILISYNCNKNWIFPESFCLIFLFISLCFLISDQGLYVFNKESD